MASDAAMKSAANEEKTNVRDHFGLPAAWPGDLTYLTDQVYSSAVTTEQRATLARPDTSEQLQKISSSLLHTPYPWLAIRTITNRSHPAYDQRGLFAASHLPPDTFVCLYLGMVHSNTPEDTDAESNYDLSFDRESGLSIDATHAGNESRMANDYRGIKDRPNAEFRDVLVQVECAKRAAGWKWERRVAIFVLSAGKAGKRKAGIRKDEEVLVNYGKSFWTARNVVESEGDFQGT